jgi:hypothetical protein
MRKFLYLPAEIPVDHKTGEFDGVRLSWRPIYLHDLNFIVFGFNRQVSNVVETTNYRGCQKFYMIKSKIIKISYRRIIQYLILHSIFGQFQHFNALHSPSFSVPWQVQISSFSVGKTFIACFKSPLYHDFPME